MQRRRLLTIQLPDEAISVDDAERISRLIVDARRTGRPLVLGGAIRVQSHDLGARATHSRLERVALAGRKQHLRAHAEATRRARRRAARVQSFYDDRELRLKRSLIRGFGLGRP